MSRCVTLDSTGIGQPCRLLGRERCRRQRQQVRELSDGSRACNWRRDRRLGEQPCKGDRSNGRVLRRSDVVQRGEHSGTACIEILLRTFGARAVNRDARSILSGQEPHGECEVRHTCHALAGADIGQGSFVFVPNHQVVMRLQRNVACEALARRCGERG